MMSPKKQINLLTYPGSKALPFATNRDVWPKYSIMQEQFWKIADDNAWKHNRSFKYVSSESSGENVPLDSQNYPTPFLDHEDGDGISIKPKSILMMRI